MDAEVYTPPNNDPYYFLKQGIKNDALSLDTNSKTSIFIKVILLVGVVLVAYFIIMKVQSINLATSQF